MYYAFMDKPTTSDVLHYAYLSESDFGAAGSYEWDLTIGTSFTRETWVSL
jgi:hypothetical protein